MSKKAKSALDTAALILLVMGIVGALLEAIYAIPLPRLITLEGAAYYQAAMSIPLVIYALSRFAIPSGLGQQIRKRVAVGDAEGANALFHRAWVMLTVAGILIAVILYFSASAIGNGMGMSASVSQSVVENAEQASKVDFNQASFAAVMRATIPFVVLTLSLAAPRAYFYGLQMAVPNLIATLVGQLVKLIFGLLIARFLMREDVLRGAAGAVTGVSIGEAASLLFLTALYFVNFGHEHLMKHRDLYAGKTAPVSADMTQGMVQSLLGFGAILVWPACVLFDVFRVAPMLTELGLSGLLAVEGYGLLFAVVGPVVCFLPVICFSLFEGISGSTYELAQRKQYARLRKLCVSVLKMSILLAVAAMWLLWIAGGDFVAVFFHNILEEGQLQVIGQLLPYMAIGAGFFIPGMMSASVLIGMKRSLMGVIVALFSLLVKVVVFLICARKPEINILAAAFSTMAALVVYGVLNMAFMMQYAGARFRWLECLLRPLLAGGIAGGIVLLLGNNLLAGSLKDSPGAALGMKLVGFVLLYVLVCVFSKAMRKKDWDSFPLYEVRM